MAYTTKKFATDFALTLYDNILSVIERDMTTALAELDATQEPVVEYEMPSFATNVFPSMFLEISRSTLEQSDDDAYIKETHEFLLTVAITGTTWVEAQDRVLKYVVAVDRVLRTMTNADLTDGVTQLVAHAAWEVVEHLYSGIISTDRMMRKDAAIRFVVEIIRR